MHRRVAGQQRARPPGPAADRAARSRRRTAGSCRASTAGRCGSITNSAGVCAISPPWIGRLDLVGASRRVCSCASEPVRKCHAWSIPCSSRVGEHVLERGRLRVGVDAQQLHAGSGRAEHRLGVEHRGRRQRADRRAFGVVEREQHDLAAERAQRDRVAELVGQREVGSRAVRAACPDRGSGSWRARRSAPELGRPGGGERDDQRAGGDRSGPASATRWTGAAQAASKRTAARGRRLASAASEQRQRDRPPRARPPRPPATASTLEFGAARALLADAGLAEPGARRWRWTRGLARRASLLAAARQRLHGGLRPRRPGRRRRARS